jgi:putative FmdB family regulatory protein
MPIYEYQCQKCGHHLEALQKISDKPLRECPECGRHTLKRLMSAPMFRLAGSGWYETDFKGDNETKRNLVGEKAEPSPAGTDTKAEAKSEATPAPKVEKAEKPPRTVVAKPAARKPAAAKAKPATRKPAKQARKR